MTIPGEHRAEKHRAEWEHRIHRTYHLTPHDVALMWDRQRGECAVCETPLVSKVWVIDHDHRTGAFRGLLCAWCNHRIVSMMERGGVERAWSAMWYLWPQQMERWLAEAL